MASHAPIAFLGVRWGVVARMTLEEAVAPTAEGAKADFFSEFKATHNYYGPVPDLAHRGRVLTPSPTRPTI